MLPSSDPAGLERLHMEGGKGCPLKGDVSVLVLSLVNNKALTELNLQHNQVSTDPYLSLFMFYDLSLF
jgi:hypothetical protein